MQRLPHPGAGHRTFAGPAVRPQQVARVAFTVGEPPAHLARVSAAAVPVRARVSPCSDSPGPLMSSPRAPGWGGGAPSHRCGSPRDSPRRLQRRLGAGQLLLNLLVGAELPPTPPRDPMPLCPRCSASQIHPHSWPGTQKAKWGLCSHSTCPIPAPRPPSFHILGPPGLPPPPPSGKLLSTWHAALRPQGEMPGGTLSTSSTRGPGPGSHLPTQSPGPTHRCPSHRPPRAPSWPSCSQQMHDPRAQPRGLTPRAPRAQPRGSLFRAPRAQPKGLPPPCSQSTA